MPLTPPTFDLLVTGTVPNQVTTETNLENRVNAALQAVQTNAEEYGTLGWVEALEANATGSNNVAATRHERFQGLPVYSTGKRYVYLHPTTNTGNVTLRIEASADFYPVLDADGDEVRPGDLVGGRFYEIRCGSGVNRNYRVIGAVSKDWRDRIEETGRLGWVEDLGETTGVNSIIAIRRAPFEAIAVYVTAKKYVFRAATANTGAVTLKIGDEPTYPIVDADGEPMEAGELVAGRYYTVRCGSDVPGSENYRLIADSVSEKTRRRAIERTGIIQTMNVSGVNAITADVDSSASNTSLFATGLLYSLVAPAANTNTNVNLKLLGSNVFLPVRTASGDRLPVAYLKKDQAYILRRFGPSDTDPHFRVIAGAETNSSTGGSSVVSVGELIAVVPTDFPDMQAAVNALRHRPANRVVIKIAAGHRLTRGLRVDGGNLAHFVIQSVDAVVKCDPGFIGASNTDIDSNMLAEVYQSENNLFVFNGGNAPVLGCLIDMGRYTSNVLTSRIAGNGWAAVACDTRVLPDCGIINAGICGIVQQGGDVAILHTEWGGAGGEGIRIQQSSGASAQRAKANDCQAINAIKILTSGAAVFASRCSNFQFQDGEAKNSGGHGLGGHRCTISATDADVSGAAQSGLNPSQGVRMIANGINASGAGDYAMLVGDDAVSVVANEADLSGAGIASIFANTATGGGHDISIWGAKTNSSTEPIGSNPFVPVIADIVGFTKFNYPDKIGILKANVDGPLAALGGGTTGQLPRKVSNAPFDIEWITPASADLELDDVIAELDGKQPLDVALTAVSALTPATDRLPYFTDEDSAALAVFTAQGRSLVAGADAAAQRDTLEIPEPADLPISDATQDALDLKQPIDDALTSLAGLTLAADKGIYSTAANTVATYDLSPYARTVLAALADADALRDEIGALEGGEGGQPVDADLTAIAALTSAADKMPYSTGSATWAMTDFTAFGRTLVALVDAAAGRTALGLTIGTNVQAQNANLAAIASLTSAADKVPYSTGSNTWGLADFTAYGRTLVSAVDAAAARSSLGSIIGTNVQAFDADLTAIAALTSAANKVPYATGSGTWALADFSAYGRTIAAIADAAAARTSLGAEKTHALTVITAADTALTAAMDRQRLYFTHAAPSLTIELDATGAFPAGMMVRGVTVNAMTIEAASGVSLNGLVAHTHTVSAGDKFELELVVDPNDWRATPTEESSQVIDFSAAVIDFLEAVKPLTLTQQDYLEGTGEAVSTIAMKNTRTPRIVAPASDIITIGFPTVGSPDLSRYVQSSISANTAVVFDLPVGDKADQVLTFIHDVLNTSGSARTLTYPTSTLTGMGFERAITIPGNGRAITSGAYYPANGASPGVFVIAPDVFATSAPIIATVNALPVRASTSSGEPTIVGALAPVDTQKDMIITWQHSVTNDPVAHTDYDTIYAGNTGGNRLMICAKWVEADGEVIPDDAGVTGRRMGATLLRFSVGRATTAEHFLPFSGTAGVDAVYSAHSRIGNAGSTAGNADHTGLTITGASMVWSGWPTTPPPGSVVMGFANVTGDTSLDAAEHTGFDRWSSEATGSTRTGIGERSPSSAAFAREQITLGGNFVKLTSVCVVQP